LFDVRCGINRGKVMGHLEGIDGGREEVLLIGDHLPIRSSLCLVGIGNIIGKSLPCLLGKGSQKVGDSQVIDPLVAYRKGEEGTLDFTRSTVAVVVELADTVTPVEPTARGLSLAS